MELVGKKALVLGAGRSGVVSAKFLTQHGAAVALHDKKDIADWPPEASSLKRDVGVDLISATIGEGLLEEIDLIVISPGVPTNTIPPAYADGTHCEVIGEVELAYRFLKGRIVGITGSNGKTTTTTLIGELLKNSGIPTSVGGNIGTPLLSLTEGSTEAGWTVVELSSFQLETIKTFRADVAVCLNVTPNHLDRYESFADYAAAKQRIFMNQTSDDVVVLNADDPITSAWAADLKARVILFSVEQELDHGLFLRGRELIFRDGTDETVLTDRDHIFLRGLHNVENVLAALAAGLACGASVTSMRETVSAFKGVEHRIEFVREIHGVRFYNDSKATSVDATLKALEAFDENDAKVVLILGGRGKNAPYAPLIPVIERRVRELVLLGEDAANIEAELGSYVKSVRVKTMADAVRAAISAASPGDVVLLAPACASFDMFSSYEERGSVFKSEVMKAADQMSREALPA